MNNKLTEPRKVRLTVDQDKALDVLKSKGFNRSKFIRQAIEEKLYNEYRQILRSVEKANEYKECPF